MSFQYTVLGSSGFIGRHLSKKFSSLNVNFWIPARNDPEIFNRNLGVVYYCIGLTADFRNRPYDTVDAHIFYLRKILEHSNYEKVIYLSSTRVYAGSESTIESQKLSVSPFSADHLYNLSKLMGENLTLSCGKQNCVVRLSNVIGTDMGRDNFVGSLLDDAQKKGKVLFRTSLDSCKDYIWIDDVIDALLLLSDSNSQTIINIASGYNTTHRQISDWIQKSLNVESTVELNAPTITYPVIDITRMKALTGREPQSPLECLQKKQTSLNII